MTIVKDATHPTGTPVPSARTFGMQNGSIVVDGAVVTIVLHLDGPAHESSTGKSEILASTGGNVDLGNGVKLGVNAFRVRPA